MRRAAFTRSLFGAFGASFLGAAACLAADRASPVIPAAVARQEAAVVAHLDSALAWYHRTQAEQAWSTQAADEFYKNNQEELANQVMVSSFAYARAMVSVIGGEGAAVAENDRESHLATLAATTAERLANLRNQQSGIDRRISAAPAEERAGLLARRQLLQAEIDLNTALVDAMGKTASLFANSGQTSATSSLADRVAARQQSVPELFDARGNAQAPKRPPAPQPPAPSEGLVNRSVELFSLIRYRRSIDALIPATDDLKKTDDAVAQPIAAELRAVLQAADEASVRAADISGREDLEQVRIQIENYAGRFKNLSAALMPLREEAMALERSRTNLNEWRTSLASQTDAILRVLFARAIALGIALAVLVAISEIWRRATFKYVHDARCRRQFLIIRRFATTILMGVVIVMGFVSDFSSLATFAGFITAGIAVALQTVILSVAAYFFLIGRYGVKVGDRVTVSGVTGDVIDIGLVRVFLMELAGTGVDLHPTGRVVVLANSALFSTVPLYKQLPGTNYAWHEVYVTMAGDADTSAVEETLFRAVNAVYEGYRPAIERQHGALERLLDFTTDVPVPAAQVRLTDAGLEVVVRYPVEIGKLAEVDGLVTKHVLAAIRKDEDLKKSLASMPRIRAALKT
jgi:small-conductance mechanosensitive channel